MEEYIYQVIGVAIFLLFPSWKIFQRAGLNPALSLCLFIPVLGILITGIVLSASSWKLSGNPEGEI